MNTRTKGRRRELRVKAVLEVLGYSVELAKMSSRFQKQNDLFGLWDVIGISATDIICIQVKANHWPTKASMQKMKEWPCPSNFRREVWRYNDREVKPLIKVL